MRIRHIVNINNCSQLIFLLHSCLQSAFPRNNQKWHSPGGGLWFCFVHHEWRLHRTARLQVRASDTGADQQVESTNTLSLRQGNLQVFQLGATSGQTGWTGWFGACLQLQQCAGGATIELGACVHRCLFPGCAHSVPEGCELVSQAVARWTNVASLLEQLWSAAVADKSLRPLVLAPVCKRLEYSRNAKG